MSRADIDSETYEWLTQRFGERVAEALVPCPGHAWPLTTDEQKTAHAHYERWANQQEDDMSELSMAEYEQDCKPLRPGVIDRRATSAADALRTHVPESLQQVAQHDCARAIQAQVEVFKWIEAVFSAARKRP